MVSLDIKFFFKIIFPFILIITIFVVSIADWLIERRINIITQENCESPCYLDEQTKSKSEEKLLPENYPTIEKNKQEKQKLEHYISNLESLIILKDKCEKGSIRWYIEWYNQRYPWHRRVYMAFGILSLSIPLFFVVFESQDQKQMLSVAIVTFLIGMTNFFAWGNAWSGFFEAKIQLEFLMQKWEATLIEAREINDEGKAIEFVQTEFNQLREQSNQIILNETKSFFNSIKFPSS